MKETGQTAASEGERAEEIVESKIESWIPISYAVRHKGRHSSLPPSALPLVPPPPAAASRIHHVSCTPQPEPPSPAQRALCPLSPPSSRALQFRDHTEVELGEGVDDDKVGGLYSVLAAEVATRATGGKIGVSLVSCRILRQHRVLGWLWRTSMIMMMICMQWAGEECAVCGWEDASMRER